LLFKFQLHLTIIDMRLITVQYKDLTRILDRTFFVPAYLTFTSARHLDILRILSLSLSLSLSTPLVHWTNTLVLQLFLRRYICQVEGQV